ITDKRTSLFIGPHLFLYPKPISQIHPTVTLIGMGGIGRYVRRKSSGGSKLLPLLQRRQPKFSRECASIWKCSFVFGRSFSRCPQPVIDTIPAFAPVSLPRLCRDIFGTARGSSKASPFSERLQTQTMGKCSGISKTSRLLYRRASALT